MKKIKIIFLALFILSITFKTDVFAQQKNETHINKNGIELTEKEYQFVNKFYGEDFFEKMTQEDYEWIMELDINNKKVEIKTIYDTNINRDNPFHSTNSKSLSIARSCGNISCTIITNLTWLVNPSNRSYDVIGARFYNTSLHNNTIQTKVTSSNGTQYFSYDKCLSNGIGTSVKLPDNGNNITVQQKIFTNLGGIVYASYQHSTSQISLQTSTWYTISATGFGGVFEFYNGAGNYFDGMGGVNISL